MKLSSGTEAAAQLATLGVAVVFQAIMLMLSPVTILLSASGDWLWGMGALLSVTAAPVFLFYALFREPKLAPLLMFYAVAAFWGATCGRLLVSLV